MTRRWSATSFGYGAQNSRGTSGLEPGGTQRGVVTLREREREERSLRARVRTLDELGEEDVRGGELVPLDGEAAARERALEEGQVARQARGRLGAVFRGVGREREADDHAARVAHTLAQHVDFRGVGRRAAAVHAVPARHVAHHRLRLREVEAVELEEGQLVEEQPARGAQRLEFGVRSQRDLREFHARRREHPTGLLRETPPRKVREARSRSVGHGGHVVMLGRFVVVRRRLQLGAL